MGGLLLLLNMVSWALGIGGFVCFILTLVKMFQNDETTMGIVCIVTFFFCFLGVLITFIVGWMNASRWQNQQVMVIWTCCIVGSIVLTLLSAAFAPPMFLMFPEGVRPM